MEYVYAALLLHKAGKKVDEASLKKVLEAASVEVDTTKIKGLVAALDGVDMEEVLKQAPVAAAPVAAAPAEEKKEEKKEEAETQESAAEGLGALFG